MRLVAIMLMSIFTYQLIFPNVAMALTSGPTQPEVQGFEPVGTTDMVDMFSGSFVYNIPLMDVEGYPINISYHGGVSMEQEASWVGLGWNINPGVINRTVRGVPDDFNGDSILKDFNIKPEKTLRVGVGAGLEIGGYGDPKLNFKIKGPNVNIGANINISNYRGVSADLSLGGGINIFHCVSTGVNLGVGSQTGASVDYNAALSLSAPMTMSKEEANPSVGLNAAVGGGYSSRSGIKDLNFSISASIQSDYKGGYDEKTKSIDPAKANGHSGSGSLFSCGAAIPIGYKNYVPVITNSSTMSTIYGRIKVGGELWGSYGYVNASAMYNKVSFANDASRRSFGYMYLQNAGIDNTDILDFTRDKDGMFNKNMEYLPVPNMTYDIYSLSGQGTGGMFRPFRNDFGSVHDPFTTSTSSGNHGEGEIGVGNVFEAGLDYTNTSTLITSGPWPGYMRSGTSKGFAKNSNGSAFENVYFKQGGELTAVDPAYFSTIGGDALLSTEDAMALPHTKPGSANKRDPRANLIYYRTAGELAGPESSTAPDGSIVSSGGGGAMSSMPTISAVDHPGVLNYTDPIFESYGNPAVDTIKRVGKGLFQRKKDQISEITQVQKDGRKYVYGIAALNNVQREVTFNATGNDVDLATGIVNVVHSDSDDTKGNHKGHDNFYGSTVTPSFAHSYLLTAVLSNDYVDVTGNGVSDDDLGTYTKLNYTRTDSDYRWIAPYSSDVSKATYSPGFWSDKTDDKGSYICGSREQWNLHSIETKNFIAEFYTSVRDDGQGIAAAVLNNGESSLLTHSKASGHSYSYKLDSIKLYNKHDRFVNEANAIPVKSVYFVYDYSLCAGIPNTATPGAGKLTLSKIYFSYGNSKKSMISPYTFAYGPNPNYDLAAKDRWGNYKPNNPAFTNYEYPYVDQNSPLNDEYASAWSLVEIGLPSGGIIQANYECCDYAYVQDRPANEMFMVAGLGKTPDFTAASNLYTDKNSPCLFTYFRRRQSSESTLLTFMQNYLGAGFRLDSANFIYFNFNVQLTNATTTFEQIKGYAKIQEVGICNNDHNYGYVKFQPQTATGGGGNLHPITQTALNVGRFNVPQIVFPGQDPDEDNMHNILAGLKGAFNELFATARNPVVSMIVHSGGKSVNLTKSYIRLQSVGLTKKGGGQRVKSLYFYDKWDALAGSNENGAFYGKQYSYKCLDKTYGEVSSGVASYEAMIGGDENPLRQPMQRYSVQAGSQFPPSDAIDLYQESPMGESLFPVGQVGYSKVTVTSVHKDDGRSAKGLDQYEFYTAKDFPVRVVASSIKATISNYYDFFTQKNDLAATQSYTLIFNDMHGKPKSVEHDVYKGTTGKYDPISYVNYKYRKAGNKLDNKVKCLVSGGTNMIEQWQQLGIEEDITFDSREKKEETSNSTFNANLNFFILPILEPTPIPYGFGWGNEVSNKFQSAVITKVIQQYGILDSVESYNDGAKTIMHNEYYDPLTGQPVVTSLNNEFQDNEYTTNIPASWVYKGMSGAYENIGFTDSNGTINIDANNIGALHITPGAPLTEGDQLEVSFESSGSRGSTILWVMGKIPEYSSSGGLLPSAEVNVLPRYPLATPGWVPGALWKNVSVKVISSGHKNMLDENVQSYTSMNTPVPGGVLSTGLNGIIDLKAKTFADSNTRIIGKYLRNPDVLNPYVIGERGQWRLLSEYAYLTNRNYGGATARNAGLFNASSLFVSSSAVPVPPYLTSPYRFLAPLPADPNWHAMRTITKWSPYGKEIENKDAIGNYSTAVFDYNEDLPVAVASNAKQGDVLSLGFENYNLLKAKSDTMIFHYYGVAYGGIVPLPGAVTGGPFIYSMTQPGVTLSGGGFVDTSICSTAGHTGTHSLFARGNAIIISLPVRSSSYTGVINKYNNYFSSNPVPLAGYQFSTANEYLDFALEIGKDYILNYWTRPSKFDANLSSYTYTVGMRVEASGSTITAFPAVKKTNIIDGWEQWEVHFKLPPGTTSARAFFSESSYVDDIRIFPANANMKAFVYSPVMSSLRATSEKLISTLDENNFGTMYEYDQEGNLVRVKKETSGGIMTVSESRSGNPKKAHQ